MIPGIKTKVTALAIIAALSGLLYSHIKLYQMGKTHESLECTKEKMAAATRAIEELNQINLINTEISEAYWQNQVAQKPKIQTVEKRIVEYVETIRPGDCDINDDELRIINNLIDIANGYQDSEAKH